MLPDGRDFLVTFPADAWTYATFRHAPDRCDVRVHPPSKLKAQRVAAAALEVLGQRGGGELHLVSELPEGKGMASSSADLVATARAVAAAFGIRFDESTLEALLRRIEPSDGVMYEGIVAFYHREVRVREVLGTLPPLAIIGHDEGGQVDTIRHNRVPKPFTHADKLEYARLLDEISRAVAESDVAAVGRVATRSAEMNLKLRPRRGFGELHRACSEVDGLGLVLAHSGTVLGVLLREEDPDLYAKAEHIRSRCAALDGHIVEHRSLSGDRLEV
ncbi:kinase [Lentzea sp. DG1S-22]|uniref:GHMP family kinase ATP-binding protein n=1 Tax=Lentzea sp. DG1S-22 TaxID=3108822 RepID=UPI002E77DF5E|nr:kinase [Lentzea sp. DG1S-22]WVH82781.1 kinase [Lentzea sp. DG1S-22]